MTGSFDRKDARIILVLLTITLVFRLWTVMMIHTGIDERDYWYSAKSISQGTEYPYVNHRTVRWGVIIPAALAQLVTGVHPNAYYVMPILNSLIQTLLLYALARRLFGRRVAVLAALCLIFFPYQIRAASQLRPEIFSITYILAMMYFFSDYVLAAERRKSLSSLVAASLFFLAAYETKITNLFFLPGMFVLIWHLKKGTKIRDSLIFGGIPLAGFLTETALYATFTDYPFGHLQIILANHVGGMESLASYLEVFKRYAEPYLQWYWQIPMVLFALLVLYTAVKNRMRELALIIVPALSFFIFVTFTVSGIHPVKMAEPFINRYFSAVLPSMFLVICYYADLFFRNRTKVHISENRFYAVTLSGMFAFIVLFSLPSVPAKIRQYICPPFSSDHPFALNNGYRMAVNDAWTAGRALVSATGNAGSNANETASWYYLNISNYIDGSAPTTVPISVDTGTGMIEILSLGGRIPARDENALNLIRSPFRMQEVPFAKLTELEGENFPD